ncbi:MAG: 50S ribosomal protein L18 [Phycisphaeraceae bacterium]
MEKNRHKRLRRSRRRAGIRKRIFGTPEQPRLSVYRSAKHIYAQVIDDVSGRTLASASTVDQKLEAGGNVAAAQQVGKTLAERAKSAGLQKVALDRGGFRYHGRVKALADAAREGGLKF